MNRTLRKVAVRGSAAMVAIALLAACGSNSVKADGSSAGAEKGPAYEAVKAHSATPTETGLTGPLSKKPAAGLHVDFLACALPVCEQQSKYFTQGAEKLGWSTKVISFQQTPEALQSAFDTAISDKPDGVVVSGFPVAAYAEKLAKLNQMGIPVVDYATTNPVGNGIIAVAGDDTTVKYGEYQAEWIAADSKGKAHVIMFNTPDFPVQVKLQDALKERLAALCSGCTFDSVDIALSDLGPDLPNRVVSEVQRKPDTNYIVLGFADLGAGVPAALKNADLNVKIATAGPQQATFQEIMDGNIAMVAAQPQEEQQWCLVDALARHNVGDPVPPNACDLPSQILTKANVTEAWATWPGVPGWQDKFLAAWHVS